MTVTPSSIGSSSDIQSAGLKVASPLYGSTSDNIPRLVSSVPSDASALGRAEPKFLAIDSLPVSNLFDLANDAERANIASTDNESVSAKLMLIKKSTPRKLIQLLFAVLAVLLLCVFVISLPWTKSWIDSHNVHPTLVKISQYVQSYTSVDSNIRVADQQDPARSEPVNPGELSKDNVQIATFFAKKYRLAASEVDKYLQFAQLAAKAKNLDPNLIIAVMSIESNLNPITESSMGAQGLMQVLTAVHLDKLAVYGGAHKVFDPEINIMVGATILADCIKLGGSVEMGLKCYVGATGPTDNGYGAKVLAEKERIEKAKLDVFDFAPNNKVLIDMGLIAANAEPISSSTLPMTIQGMNALDRDRTTQIGTQPGGLNAGTTVPPLIPATVTALPTIPQATIAPQSAPTHSVSGTVKQERSDAPSATHK